MTSWREFSLAAGLSVAALGSAAAPCAAQDPGRAPADSVISRVLDAYGGIDAIRAIDALRQEGILVAMQGEHGRLTRLCGGPDALAVLVEYPDRSELRVLEEGSALRGADAATLSAVSGPLKDAMVLQAARTWLPRLLDERRADATVSGSEGGRTILDVRIGESLVLRAFVEDVTGLIVRSESVLESAPGPIGFATDYSDFRRVAGVVFAFREETFASGMHTGSTVLESVEVNPTGARATLHPPKGS